MSFLDRVFRPAAIAALERENAELREKLDAVEVEGKLADRVWFLEVENRKLKGMQPNAELTNSKVIDELRESLSAINSNRAGWQRKAEVYEARLWEAEACLSRAEKALEISISEKERVLKGARNQAESLRISRAAAEASLSAEIKHLEGLLASTRGRLGGKTKSFNAMARKADSNKSHLGRFYWPATAYCEVKRDVPDYSEN